MHCPECNAEINPEELTEPGICPECGAELPEDSADLPMDDLISDDLSEEDDDDDENTVELDDDIFQDDQKESQSDQKENGKKSKKNLMLIIIIAASVIILGLLYFLVIHPKFISTRNEVDSTVVDSGEEDLSFLEDDDFAFEEDSDFWGETSDSAVEDTSLAFLDEDQPGETSETTEEAETKDSVDPIDTMFSDSPAQDDSLVLQETGIQDTQEIQDTIVEEDSVALAIQDSLAALEQEDSSQIDFVKQESKPEKDRTQDSLVKKKDTAVKKTTVPTPQPVQKTSTVRKPQERKVPDNWGQQPNLDKILRQRESKGKLSSSSEQRQVSPNVRISSDNRLSSSSQSSTITVNPPATQVVQQERVQAKILYPLKASVSLINNRSFLQDARINHEHIEYLSFTSSRLKSIDQNDILKIHFRYQGPMRYQGQSNVYLVKADITTKSGDYFRNTMIEDIEIVFKDGTKYLIKDKFIRTKTINSIRSVSFMSGGK